MLNRGALIRVALWIAALGGAPGALADASADGQAVPLSVDRFIATSHRTQSQLVELRGVVTALVGRDAYFLQDPTGAVLVYSLDGFPKVHANDRVLARGFARQGGVSPYLAAQQSAVLEQRVSIAPVDVDARRSIGIDFDGRLARVRARVSRDNASLPEGAEVLVDAFQGTLRVIFDGPGDLGRWPELESGDLVQATGVLSATRARGSSAFVWRMFVRSRNDVVRLAPVPWWIAHRNLLLGASLGSAGLLGWWGVRRRRRSRVAVAPSALELPPKMSLGIRALVGSDEMERRYQELFESATDVILTHDLEGNITSFNPAGERILGWPASEVIGKPIYSILAPAEAAIEGGLVKGGRSETVTSGSFKLEFKTRDGRTAPFEVNSWIEYHDGEAVGVQAICRDISHRIRSEDERHRFERKLQETQKLESLGILAGGIAHDFNNLLTAVLGNASLARIELPPDSPTQKSLEEIELAAERASDLCSQMLAYSGQGRFILSRVNLSALVFETLELIQASVSKRAKLDLQLGENLPAVHGDTVQLRQVLVNLVTNASEALGDGHGSVTIRTSSFTPDSKWVVDAQLVPETFEGEYVLLEVTDTGCGMNPETAARIFEPFFTTKFTGRGLGLAAVLGIVRSHRGALKVETHLGQGTSFWIALPAISVLNIGGAPGSDVEHRPLFQATVLVVDDEATVRRTVTRVLEAMGCKVVVAEDGTVALERLRQYGRPFDLVLLDLTMPQMDGVQTLRELRRLRPDLPVILMSGFAQTQAMARFNEHRLSGFLQKPFKIDELSRLIGRILSDQQELFANVPS